MGNACLGQASKTKASPDKCSEERPTQVRNILLVEDSEQYQKIVKRALSHHTILCAGDVDTALELLSQNSYDLILLDISLPKKNGYNLLSEIQSDPERCRIPIICLTAKTEVTDKVTAFSLGAEDYIVKPFDPIELRARVDAKLSRLDRKPNTSDVIQIGAIEIDTARHRVSIQLDGRKKTISVTQTEFKLLACLAKHPDQVYTRDQLLVAAWGEDARVLDRAVDVHLCSLRKKLKDISSCIEAVPGVGYRFSPEKATCSNKKAA